jgi:hypothetical protein
MFPVKKLGLSAEGAIVRLAGIALDYRIERG